MHCFVFALTDCACGHRHRAQQCCPYHIPSAVPCDARVRRSAGRSSVDVLARLAVGAIRLVGDRNHSIWFLRIQFARRRTKYFGMVEVSSQLYIYLSTRGRGEYVT